MTDHDLDLALDHIAGRILRLRGENVMLDADLADLYGVETRALLQAVRRHASRFPDDFMFELTTDEVANLRSQSVISSAWGGRRYLPRAFTEQGVAMVASVLGSERAIQVNVAIIRAFVRVRQVLASHAGLALKLDVLERKYDEQFRVVFDAIRELMAKPDPPSRPLGFRPDDS